MSSSDSLVRLAILDEFLAGRNPSVRSIALAVGADVESTAAAFDRLAAGRAIVLKPGRDRDILMAAPFSGVKTDFRVIVNEKSYYANCVWDSLGIPAMLAGADREDTATIETRCGDCSAPLVLQVERGEVRAEPPEVVAHFAVPAARWWSDIVFT